MKRRDFLSMFLAAATALSPRTGAAQQPERMRRVGELLPFAENDVPALACVKDLAQALHRRGCTDDKNIRIDTRFAANDPARLDAYAAELVAVSPDALLAAIPPAVAALRKRTGTIPIVFTYVADPVGQGIVKNLARPGRQHHRDQLLRCAYDGKVATIAEGGRSERDAGRHYLQSGYGPVCTLP